MPTETQREEERRKSSIKEINGREWEREPEAVPSDTQESVDIELLELGSDGHEELCHKCTLDGELLCCDGCPIAMHHQCIELLGLIAPESLRDAWFCPICSERKAARVVAEAEKVSFFILKKSSDGYYMQLIFRIPAVERSLTRLAS